MRFEGMVDGCPATRDGSRVDMETHQMTRRRQGYQHYSVCHRYDTYIQGTRRHTYTFACVCVCVYILICVYMYINTHTHIYIYIHIHIYLHTSLLLSPPENTLLTGLDCSFMREFWAGFLGNWWFGTGVRDLTNHRKTTGKPWENGGLMGFNGSYPTW